MADRYEGKPLLRLLELYVLWCIDELSDNDRAAMEEMTPHLQRVYQRTGTWQEILESVMGLPPNAPEQVRAVWKTARAGGAAANVPIPAETFARMFVDRNLT
jgi:hypothetical protein